LSAQPRWPGLALALLALAGCPKKGPDEAVYSWADTPTLPSPSAGTYARAPGLPPDPPLAALLAGTRWDASLSGAAAGIALALAETPALPNWQVRHEVWRAGYPYPVQTLSVWHGPKEGPPPVGVAAWLAKLPSDADLGLVRARNVNADTWVGLLATPRGNVGVQPRQLPLGASFTLPPIDGARFVVADSLGGLKAGTLELPQTFTVDHPGEWLVKVTDATGVLARFPIYVGVTPPTEPVVGEPVEGDSVTQLRDLVAHLRAVHGLEDFSEDLLFDAAARRQLQKGTLTKDELAARLGWDSQALSTWDVQASSVAEALDRVIWEPESRPALLSEAAVAGIAAEDTSNGVRVVVIVGFGDEGT
jgi:hypothetical protein